MSLRTLRQACRDIAATQPESTDVDCGSCGNRELCEVSKQLERDRRKNLSIARSNPATH
jgi:hypothetical protein